MNREIKFRCWDGNAKEMSEFTTNAFVKAKSLMFNGAIKELEEQGYTLMQYTGLHDKNGKEIYEGDILRMRCGSDDGAFNKAEIPGEVVWDKDRFTIRLPDRKFVPVQGTEKGKEISSHKMHSWVGMHTCLLVWSSKLEIIGNRFANPDLLA